MPAAKSPPPGQKNKPVPLLHLFRLLLLYKIFQLQDPPSSFSHFTLFPIPQWFWLLKFIFLLKKEETPVIAQLKCERWEDTNESNALRQPVLVVSHSNLPQSDPQLGGASPFCPHSTLVFKPHINHLDRNLAAQMQAGGTVLSSLLLLPLPTCRRDLELFLPPSALSASVHRPPQASWRVSSCSAPLPPSPPGHVRSAPEKATGACLAAPGDSADGLAQTEDGEGSERPVTLQS